MFECVCVCVCLCVCVVYCHASGSSWCIYLHYHNFPSDEILRKKQMLNSPYAKIVS